MEYIIYYSYVALLFFFLIHRNIEKKYQNFKILYFLITLYLILICGFREIGISVDDFNYLNMIENAKLGVSWKDPAFTFIAREIKNPQLIIFSFALLSIYLKGAYLINQTKNYSILFVLYFSSHYLLHDFVQIRTAVISGLLLWIIHNLKKDNIVNVLLLTAIAIPFHLSSILFISFLLLRFIKKKKIVIIISAISILTTVLISIDLPILLEILPDFISIRLYSYINVDYEAVNLFNPISIIHFTIAILIIYKWNHLQSIEGKMIHYSIYLMGVFLFLIFHKTVVVYRLYELLIIAQIPVIDSLLKNYNKKLISILTILLSILYMYYYTIKYPLISEYSFFF